jgi:hypothetical protein
VGEAENSSNPARPYTHADPGKSAMREHGPPAKYLVLPPNIDIKDIVIEVNTKLTEVEHCGEPFDDTSSTE